MTSTAADPGEFGSDTVLGTAGDDTIEVSGPTALITLIDGLEGDDLILASGGAFSILGAAGNDSLSADGGMETTFGGDGDDLIITGAGRSIVNGDDGADIIVGRSLAGDTLYGGQGADWIVATASSGANVVNGNQDNDTIFGGAVGSTLRGGQGDDSIVGGSGNDVLFGDDGQDTLTGGAGADVFRPTSHGGRAFVTDFNYAEGDRVHYSAPLFVSSTTQDGEDVQVIFFGAGERSLVFSIGAGAIIVVKNVQLSSLPEDWIGLT